MEWIGPRPSTGLRLAVPDRSVCMPLPAAMVLFAVVWFVCLFAILPLRLRTQDESGSTVPGTPASAPTDFDLVRKLRKVTLVATIVWVGLCAIIVLDLLTLSDIDIAGRLNLRPD